MTEYIDREKAIDLFYPIDPENDGSDGCTVVYQSGNYSSAEIESMLSELPAADVASVRHGKWKGYRKNLGECSECGEIVASRFRYCPNCGAKMDDNNRIRKEDL